MDITEPVTMLTDYALGGVNLFFSISVFSNITSRNKVTGLLLGLGFLAGAIAAFAGGTYHGFALHFEQNQLRRMWNLVMCSIGAMGGFLGSGVHAAAVKRDNGQWIIAGAVVTIIGLAIQVTGFRSHQDFNHNDVFHVIQIIATCVFFKGARRLQDRSYSPK